MLTQPSFEQWLEEKYIEQGEDNGMSITKDNVEDMFDRFLQKSDVQEIMDYADRYGKLMYVLGQRDQIAEHLNYLNDKKHDIL